MSFVWWLLFYLLKPLNWFGGLSLPFKLPSIITIVVILLIMAVPAALTWHYLTVHYKSELATARTDTANEIKTAIERDVERKIVEADKAAAAVVEPKNDQDLIEICKRSASCRDRESVK